jgi:hypothetical protein
MKGGHRPQDIHTCTVRYLDYFGIDGFKESDLKLLLGWAIQINEFGTKVFGLLQQS